MACILQIRQATSDIPAEPHRVYRRLRLDIAWRLARHQHSCFY